jgi:hypothetical protein
MPTWSNAVEARSDLQRAEEMLSNEKAHRNNYYSHPLGSVEDHDGILAVYNQNGRNMHNEHVRRLENYVASLRPPTYSRPIATAVSHNAFVAKNMNAAPRKMVARSMNRVAAPMASVANNNNMSNPLNRVNSTLFKRSKFSRKNRRSTRKNRRTTRKYNA